MTRCAVRWLAPLSLALCACVAGGQRSAFDLSRADNRPQELEALEDLAGAARLAPGAPYAIVYTNGEPARLLRYPIHVGNDPAQPVAVGEPVAVWERKLPLDARPAALPDALVSASQGQLLVLDPASGRDRFRSPLAEPLLLGAAQVGQTLVAVTLKDTPPVRSAVTGFDLATGRIRFEHRVEGRLGQPAALGSRVLLPWNAQFMVALDGETGREVARLRSRHGRITWVRTQPDGIYFGDERIYRGLPAYLDADASRRDGRAGWTLPLLDLPGSPLPFPSGFEPRPATRSAHGRVRVHFRLHAGATTTDSGGVASQPWAAGPGLHFVFYRHIYGLDAQGAPRWAQVLDADVVTAEATPVGLMALTQAGELLHLAATDGRVLGRSRLPVPDIASAVLAHVGTPVSPSQAPAHDAANPRPPVRQQLLEVALDTDSRLVPSREFALWHLASRPEADVTRDLIDIYQQTTTPAAMKAEVRRRLLQRRDGVSHLLDALLQRYDFLDQSRPAPLELLVPALVAQGGSGVAPEGTRSLALARLAARLLDHETAVEHLVPVVEAIESLGGADAVPVLTRFLSLYRADSFAAQHPEPFVAATHALLRLSEGSRDAPTRARLQAIATDRRTVEPLHRALLAALNPPTAPALAAATPPPAPGPAPPTRLDQATINGTFASLADDIRACALDELGRDPELARVRIAFVLDDQGRTRTRTYAPNSPDLEACLDPKVAALRFPPSQARQQLGDYVVALRSRPPVAPATDASGKWWAPFAQDETEPPNAPPWWMDQNPLVLRVDAGFTRRPIGGPAAPSPQPASATRQRAKPPTTAPSWVEQVPTVTTTTTPAQAPSPRDPSAGRSSGTAVPDATPAPSASGEAASGTTAAPGPAGSESAKPDSWWLPTAPPPDSD